MVCIYDSIDRSSECFLCTLGRKSIVNRVLRFLEEVRYEDHILILFTRISDFNHDSTKKRQL